MVDELHFESLKLLPGARLDLQSEQYAHLRGASEFIGYYNHKTIIIATPVAGGVPVPCKVGNQVVLRFFVNHLNCACAFRCDIVHVAAVPYPHLHISIPDDMEIGEVRKSSRANVDLKAMIRVQTDNKSEILATIKNLSVDGSKMESQFMLGKEGDEILVSTEIEMFDVGKLIKIKAVICSIKSKTDGSYGYGLRFFDQTYGTKVFIYAYVLSKIVG